MYTPKSEVLLKKAYQGDVFIPQNAFKSVKAAINAGGRIIKVCAIGDSVTEGADVSLQANNAINRLVNLLRDSIANKVDFRNYAVGGAVLANFVNNNYIKRPWSEGRRWQDAVMAFSPDLLVVAFGVNDGAKPYLDFYEYLRRFRNEFLRKIPNTSVLFINNTQDVHEKNRIYLEWTAKSQVYFCREYKYPCINANRVFNILGNGIDLYSYIGKQQPMYFGEFVSEWDVTPTVVRTYNYLTFTGDGSIRYKTPAQNIQFNAIVDITKYQSIFPSRYDLGFRENLIFANVIGIVVRMVIKTDKTVDFYISHGVKGVLAAQNFRVGSIFDLEIRFHDNRLTIHIDKGQVMEAIISDAGFEGTFYIRSFQEDKILFKNPGFQYTQFEEGEPLFSIEDLLGGVGNLGGNGVNHLPDHAFGLIYQSAIEKVVRAITH